MRAEPQQNIMQYNNTTDKNGLLQLCEQLCSLGDGAITGDTRLKSMFTNYLNIAQGEAVSAIMQVDKNHNYDDYNYGDIADAPIALVADQYDYTIPVASVGANLSTNLRVKGLYLLLNSVRNYLRYMRQDEALYEVSGLPDAYKLNGGSIFFNVPPDATTVSTYTNFHVEFQRVQDKFTTSDNTQEPGILEIYHPALAVKASAIYMLPIDRTLALTYSTGDMNRPGMFENQLYGLMRDWGNMAGDAPKTITPKLTPHI